MTNQVNCYDVPQYFFAAATTNSASSWVYEPGCGGGRLVVELAGRGFQVTGVDQSRSAVEFTRQTLTDRGLNAEIVVGDMREPLTDAEFDVAYCLVNTFRHLLTEEDATY